MATAIPVGTATRSPGCELEIDSGVKVDSGIADMRPRGNFQFRIETYEVNLHGVTGIGRDDLTTVSETRR